jgi:hypothetical protein
MVVRSRTNKWTLRMSSHTNKPLLLLCLSRLVRRLKGQVISGQLMTKIMKGRTGQKYSVSSMEAVHMKANQCTSMQIHAHQCKSVHISANLCTSMQISAHQCRSMQLSAHQCKSVQISATWCRSMQLGAHQCKSGCIEVH